jgi:hypothetical protein
MSGPAQDSDQSIFRFTVGSVECAAINDGTFIYEAEQSSTTPVRTP